jgi:DUF4097 and DUF4098 domain-containing protein YvlB
VAARAVGVDEADIDTGSGAVTLELDRMGAGTFRIDTGSGSITLRVPPDASAEVDAETGSGGIDLDVGEVQVRRMERDEASFVIGDGRAQVSLDTGSGRIRVTR